MPDQPLVSIIIPTYNRARLFREALTSAQAQTYAPLEIVIVDDASTDETPEIARSAADADDRVRFIQQEHNVGPNRNWQTGILTSQGDYFCFLADDDTLLPTFTQALVEPFQVNANLVVSFSDHHVVDEHGAPLPESTEATYRSYGRAALTEGKVADFVQTALLDESIYIGAAMFNRRLLGPAPLDPKAGSAIGGWLFYQSARTGGACHYVDKRLMHCRWIEGSVSRSRRWQPALNKGTQYRFERMLQDQALQDYHALLRRRYTNFLIAQAPALLHTGNHEAARDFSAKALAHTFSVKALAVWVLATLGPAGTHVARLIKRLSPLSDKRIWEE